MCTARHSMLSIKPQLGKRQNLDHCNPSPSLSMFVSQLSYCKASQSDLHSYGKPLLQSGNASAFQQADSWVASASAWAVRLLAAFPLYRDLLQPVALAVHEMRAGLATLVRAQKGMQSAVQDQQMGLVVAQLGALTQGDRHDGAFQALPMVHTTRKGTCTLFTSRGVPEESQA